MKGIKLDKVTFEFTQEENCCSNDMDGIELLTVECMSSMGISDDGGCFFVLKTEQWSIDGGDDLKLLLETIEQAINMVK